MGTLAIVRDATSTGGRTGSTRSSDGRIQLDLSTPKELGGDGGAGTIGAMTGKPGAFGIAVDMAMSIPGMDQAAAQALVDAAHEVCPYSNATRGNIDVVLRVV